jgi:hypothetical protein
MAFTTYFHLSKPAQGTQRYDLELNLNMDDIEKALLGFPGADPPGSPGNYPDVSPTTGMRWVDTTNHQEKVYYNGTWQMVKQFT